MIAGRRAGVISALGIGSGVLVHTLFAALGLSAILATSAWAFTVVKVAGAACNALSPEVAVFFPAFLPQFVDPGQGLGRHRPGLMGRVERLSGCVDIGLGLNLLRASPQPAH